MGDQEQEVGLGVGAGQGSFVNNFTHALDAKKRLTIPSEWREAVGMPQSVIVMPSVNDPCLCVYPAREMSRRMEKFRNVSIADRQARHFARMLASRSNLLPWDAQGRIRVSDDLLRFAELEGEVVLVGGFDCFELWSPKRWNALMQSETQSSLGEAARSLGF